MLYFVDNFFVLKNKFFNILASFTTVFTCLSPFEYTFHWKHQFELIFHFLYDQITQEQLIPGYHHGGLANVRTRRLGVTEDNIYHCQKLLGSFHIEK